MSKTTWKSVKQSAMNWHIAHLKNKGWEMIDIQIKPISGLVKQAIFVNEDGDRIILEPKVLPKYNASRNGPYNKWKRTKDTYRSIGGRVNSGETNLIAESQTKTDTN